MATTQSLDLFPTNDFVLMLEEIPVSYEAYKGYTHIVTPDKYSHGPEDRIVTGTVVAKGANCTNPEIPVGAKIVVGKWDGARIERNGKKLLLVKEDSVLAVFQ